MTNENFLFDFYKTLYFFLNFTVASSRNNISYTEQIINVPNVICVFVKIDSHRKNSFLVVDDLLYYFHLVITPLLLKA